MVVSTTARDRESTVTTVLPLLRPRLARAMEKGDTLPLPRFAFFLLWLPSVYRTASMGETFAASRPGLAQDSSTVNRANRAEPTKIRGCTDTVLTTPSSRWITMGASRPPTIQPSTSRSRALICRPVVPMVFSRP